MMRPARRSAGLIVSLLFTWLTVQAAPGVCAADFTTFTLPNPQASSAPSAAEPVAAAGSGQLQWVPLKAAPPPYQLTANLDVQAGREAGRWALGLEGHVRGYVGDTALDTAFKLQRALGTTAWQLSVDGAQLTMPLGYVRVGALRSQALGLAQTAAKLRGVEFLPNTGGAYGLDLVAATDGQLGVLSLASEFSAGDGTIRPQIVAYRGAGMGAGRLDLGASGRLGTAVGRVNGAVNLQPGTGASAGAVTLAQTLGRWSTDEVGGWASAGYAIPGGTGTTPDSRRLVVVARTSGRAWTFTTQGTLSGNSDHWTDADARGGLSRRLGPLALGVGVDVRKAWTPVSDADVGWSTDVSAGPLSLGYFWHPRVGSKTLTGRVELAPRLPFGLDGALSLGAEVPLGADRLSADASLKAGGRLSKHWSAFSLDLTGDYAAARTQGKLTTTGTAELRFSYRRDPWTAGAALELAARHAPQYALQFSWRFALTGHLPRGRIRGRVFLDQNQNGRYDAGVDPPVAGQELRIGDSPANRVKSDADGAFTVAGVPPGRYTVTLGTPAYPAAYLLEHTSASLIVGVQAGETTPLSIPLERGGEVEIVTYVDANDNGRRDASEVDIGTVWVWLGDLPFATDASGRAHVFLRPGTYKVTLDAGKLPSSVVLSPQTPAQVVVPSGGQAPVRLEIPLRPAANAATFVDFG